MHSARRVAERFLAAAKGKQPPSLESFLNRYAERDAIKGARNDSSRITGDMMAEVAWEIGYEGDPYNDTLAEFEPLAKKMKVNLRAEYDRGAADHANE